MRRLLVLWDIDFTLIGASGVGQRLYGMVFRDMFGRELPGIAPMAGRTDRAIIIDTLARAGIPEPRAQADQFIARLTALAPAGRELAAGHSLALPGAAAALTALARYALDPASTPSGSPPDGQTAGPGEVPADLAAHPGGRAPLGVVQSVLTGNIRPVAEVKLGAAGLTGHLDLSIGAYGESHEVRAELVHLARRNAARRYGADFAGQQTVLVGDTELDVAAALATGARVVGVATGGTTAEKLAAAGADAVLPGLADTAATLAAILGNGPAPGGPDGTEGRDGSGSSGGPEAVAGLPDQRQPGVVVRRPAGRRTHPGQVSARSAGRPGTVRRESSSSKMAAVVATPSGVAMGPVPSASVRSRPCTTASTTRLGTNSPSCISA